MRDIIAIGGGSIGELKTLEIDRIFIERTRKSNPTLLFIPTASDDSVEYTDVIQRVYGDVLGCKVEAMYLLSGFCDISAIDRADAIYVGGGNTKKMLEVWRQTGVADALKRVIGEGKPVGGLSAGAICWFRVGNSDWPQYEGLEGINTARLDGLNLVDLAICPHTRDEGFRLAEFRAMMRSEGGIGIGLDDGCALHIRGAEYRILSSIDGSVAHRIEWQGEHLTETVIEPSNTFRPLESI